MKRELGFGYCGLICALCNENKGCVGCKKGGCKNKEQCKSYVCCTSKGYSYCYECNAFPCTDSILIKKRIYLFCKLLEQYGEERLLNALEENERRGIVYHHRNSHIGDYDRLTEEELITLLFH